MMTLKPELQKPLPVVMTTTNVRHISAAPQAGFRGSFDHGGIVSDFSTQLRTAAFGSGSALAELGQKTGAAAVLRDGSGSNINAATGINSHAVSFSGEMLKALDKVSTLDNRTSALAQEAITNPGSVDAHDITIAEAEASMAMSIARTILNRLTQAWRDIINTR
ncbi:MAG: flagellar hook-basal body complex protein FliE [Spirochaetaceae bacterium]|jgi:flagellar hook-basal body complex protein FliE|nr:flagellar hook-basal body complex protein FliE [Spirochaetaceae bacterium]